MKEIKNFIAITLLIVGGVLLAKFQLKAIPFIIFVFFLAHLFLRKRTWARGYLSSKWNILTSKRTYEREMEMPADLAFEKLQEVLKASGFKLFHVNEQRKELYATSKMSWFSWGENLYLEIENQGDSSLLKLSSVGFFQLSYSFGKNESNYNRLISQFEESMII